MSTQAAMPAYPYVETVYRFGNEEAVVHEGLTKREVFAMAAMQGLSTQLHYQLISEIAGGIRGGKTVATAAVILADALLSALSDQPTRQEDA